MLPSLKLSSVLIAKTILSLNFPGLIRYASHLLQPLYSLLHKREVQHVPDLFLGILDTLTVG